jgi:hypothetical protein
MGRASRKRSSRVHRRSDLTPSEVLRLHVELKETSSDPLFHHYVNNLVDVTLGRRDPSKPPPSLDRAFGVIPENTPVAGLKSKAEVPSALYLASNSSAVQNLATPGRLLHRAVEAAETFSVSPEMCDLVQAAADALDDSDPIGEFEPPTRCGLAYFSRPIVVYDIRGSRMLAHWVLWSPGSDLLGRPAWSMWLFNDIAIEPDEVTVFSAKSLTRGQESGESRLLRIHGRFSPFGHAPLPRPDSIGPRMFEPDAETFSEYARKGVLARPWTNTRRSILALWAMLGQTLVATDRPALDGGSLGLAKRAGLPGRVTVIELRRRAPGAAPSTSTPVEWDHRWLVRGHWRNQRFGPGRTQTRKIWISGFVKGPEDKPLKVTDKVYTLSR